MQVKNIGLRACEKIGTKAILMKFFCNFSDASRGQLE